MEFLDFDKTVSALTDSGITTTSEGDLVHFVLETPEARRLVIGPPDAPNGEGDARIEVDAAALPRITEEIFHALHVGEVLLIPVGTWRNIIDIAAFDLAEDENWLEIDAEASLHQSGRDPLVLAPAQRTMIETIVKALLEHGSGPSEHLTILASGTTFVLEVRQPGVLVVSCDGEAIVDTLRERLTPAPS